MMDIHTLTTTSLKRLEFGYRTALRIPEKNGIYILTTFSGQVLYVGISKNLRRRIKEHLMSIKTELTPQGAAFWVYYRLCDTYESNQMERGWLNQAVLTDGRLPYFNKVIP